MRSVVNTALKACRDENAPSRLKAITRTWNSWSRNHYCTRKASPFQLPRPNSQS
ncbi:hypothetical protein DWB58_31825 [candidate division KSB1 bacterium]|nr:hypothetical protein [candidate division KSB1 bacterium]